METGHKRSEFQISKLRVARIANFRPLVVFAFALGTGILFAQKIGQTAEIVLAVLEALLFGISMKYKKRGMMLFLAAFLFGMLRLTLFEPNLPEDPSGVLIGRVAEQPEQTESSTQLVLNRITLNGESVSGRVKLYVKSGSFEYGDLVRVTASLTVPDSQMNDGEMDLALYYRGKGIIAIAYADTAEKSKGSGDLYGLCLGLREWMKSNIKSLFPSQSSLITGILLGDKSSLPEADLEAFRDTGVAHILAVSGLHVSALIWGINLILKRLKASVRFGVIACFLLVYCALVAFSPSVVRASIMACFLLLAEVLARRYDAPSALGAAAIVLLIIEPYTLFQVGFQLSFAAVGGILLLYPVFQSALRRLFAPLRDAVAVSLAATFGTLPFSVPVFYRLPLLSIFANLLVVPLMPLIMMPTLLITLLYPLLPKLTALAAKGITFLLDVIMSVVRLLSSVEGGVLSVADPGWPACTLFVAGCFLLSPYFLRSLRKRVLFGASALLLSVLLAFTPYCFKTELKLTLLAESHTGAAVLESGGNTILLDPGYGENTPVSGWLNAHGITVISAVFVADRGNAGAVAALDDAFEINDVYVLSSGQKYESILEDARIFRKSFLKGSVLSVGDSLTITAEENGLCVSAFGTAMVIGGSEHDAFLRVSDASEAKGHHDSLLILTGGGEGEAEKTLSLQNTGQLEIVTNGASVTCTAKYTSTSLSIRLETTSK